MQNEERPVARPTDEEEFERRMVETDGAMAAIREYRDMQWRLQLAAIARGLGVQ